MAFSVRRSIRAGSWPREPLNWRRIITIALAKSSFLLFSLSPLVGEGYTAPLQTETWS